MVLKATIKTSSGLFFLFGCISLHILGAFHAVMGVLADLVSLFINLDIGPYSPQILDSVEAGFLDDGGVVVL